MPSIKLSVNNTVGYDYTPMEIYPQADFKIYVHEIYVYALPR